MASSAYLTIKGQKQGQINGGVTTAGHQNTILVHAFSNEILSPRDPTTGLPTGKRQHEPITILKEIDKSSVPLWTALINNENLTTWQLQFYATDPTGKEVEVYTISLTNASIASINQSMLDNEIPADAALPLQEEVSFTYQKIQWSWTNPPLTAQDDWAAPAT
jgi:type VI secretion system secreted protein Hcp